MDPNLNEAEISSIVEAGGGRFIGVLKEVPEKSEAFVLFISPETKSTLAIPISLLTVEAVRQQLAESNAAFGEQSMPKGTQFTGRPKDHETQRIGPTERCAHVCGRVLRVSSRSHR
jgi:hypothetical protein